MNIISCYIFNIQPGLRWVWAAKSIWRRGTIPIKLSSSAGEESTTCSQGLQLLLQGHNSFGNPGGSHHQAGASSSYYGNHLGGICYSITDKEVISPILLSLILINDYLTVQVTHTQLKAQLQNHPQFTR